MRLAETLRCCAISVPRLLACVFDMAHRTANKLQMTVYIVHGAPRAGGIGPWLADWLKMTPYPPNYPPACGRCPGFAPRAKKYPPRRTIPKYIKSKVPAMSHRPHINLLQFLHNLPHTWLMADVTFKSPLHLEQAAPEPRKLEPGEVFARLNHETGLLELIDMKTGGVVAIQKSQDSYLLERRELLVEHKLPSGEVVLLEKGIDPRLVAQHQFMKCNQLIVDLICQDIAEGGRITKICTKQGFPSYAQFCAWRRAHPHIQKQLEEAYRDRAETLREKVLDEADRAEESTINESRVRIDAFKWVAGVDNPRFSPKAKVEATINTPTQIIVHTGIDRSPLVDAQIPEPVQIQTNINITEDNEDGEP